MLCAILLRQGLGGQGAPSRKKASRLIGPRTRPAAKGAALARRKEYDFNPRPLDPDHAAERNAVRFAGRKRRAGHQHANAGISLDGIQRHNRIYECDGFMIGGA